MAKRENELGRLVSVHVIGAAYVQRAVFMAVLSFMFFLAMMFAFYIRQHILYFFLASAFLIIYLLTMFSWVMQRKRNVEVYENGLRYRKNIVLWSEITAVSAKGEIIIGSGKAIALPQTVSDLSELIVTIKTKTNS